MQDVAPSQELARPPANGQRDGEAGGGNGAALPDAILGMQKAAGNRAVAGALSTPKRPKPAVAQSFLTQWEHPVEVEEAKEEEPAPVEDGPAPSGGPALPEAPPADAGPGTPDDAKGGPTGSASARPPGEPFGTLLANVPPPGARTPVPGVVAPPPAPPPGPATAADVAAASRVAAPAFEGPLEWFADLLGSLAGAFTSLFGGGGGEATPGAPPATPGETAAPAAGRGTPGTAPPAAPPAGTAPAPAAGPPAPASASTNGPTAAAAKPAKVPTNPPAPPAPPPAAPAGAAPAGPGTTPAAPAAPTTASTAPAAPPATAATATAGTPPVAPPAAAVATPAGPSPGGRGAAPAAASAATTATTATTAVPQAPPAPAPKATGAAPKPAAGPAPKPKPKPKRRPGGGGGGGGGAPAAPARRPLGDAALERWRAAVDAKAGAIEKPDLAESKKAGGKLAGKGDEVDKRKKKADDLAKDAKSRQKPPPEEPARQPKLDPSPLVAILDAVESKGQLKLSTQTIPALDPLPVYPGLTAADYLPGKVTKQPPPDPGGEGKKGPGTVAEPSTKDPKADATKEKVDAKTVEPQPAPAPQPISLEDKGAAKLTPPPKEQGDQIVDVLANIQKKAPKHAETITLAGKKALGRPTGIASLDALAADEVPAVQVDIKAELDQIASSAGFTKEQLDAKVLALKEDGTKQAQEASDTIAAEDTKAKAKIKGVGDEEAGAIAGIAQASIQEAEDKAAAAQGQPDPAVIERRRDDALGKIESSVASGMARYRATSEKRLEEIDEGIRQQKAAYASAVTTQVRAIRRHVDPDGTKMEEAKAATRPTEDFGRRKASELEALRTKLRTQASAEAAKLSGDLSAAGTEARDKVRDWAAKEIGTERGWWQRLLDMLSDWMRQSTASTKAWEEQRAAESRDAIANDFTMLADMRQLLEEQKNGEFAAKMATLSDAQRAIVNAYLAGGGKDAIGAIAEGTIERIRSRKAPELAKKWEQEAAEHWTDWIELQSLARAKNPNFNAQEIGNEVRGAVAQVGTDEAKLFANLGKARTAIERRAVDRYYLATFKTTIQSDVKSDTSGDEEDRAVALMEGRHADAAAAALDDAIGYISDDEQAIYDQLRGKTPEERAEIAAAYKARTGKELKGVLEDNMSGAELEQATLLLQNRDDEAVAAELQVAFEVWDGTDEDGVAKVFDRNREAVEAEARQKGWSTAEVEAEVKRRNKAVADAYEKKYDKPLSVALKQEMSGEDLELAKAHVSGDQTAIDAAKLRVEEDSWVYVSDDRVEEVLRHQRTRAETEFDRELERKRNYLMERQNAGDFTEEEWKARKSEIQAEKAARDETVKKQSKQYMDKMVKAYDAAPGGKAGDFARMLEEDVSGASQAEAKALVEQGALSAEDDLFYGVEGLGTDVKQLKQTLKGKSRDEIKAIEARYNEKNKPRTLWGDLGDDLSGRDYTDVMAEVIYGEPQTPQELRDKLKFKASMDKSGLWDDLFGDDLNVAGQISELDRAIAAMEAAEASGDPEKIAHATDIVNAMNVGVGAGIENSRIVADSVIDTAAQVGAAVVGIVVTIATMGGGAPLAAATWGAMATSAAAGAAASMVTGLAIKTALKGGNMSLEEFGTDLAVGGVDILTAIATAGLSKVILNSATMKAIAGPTARKLVQNLASGGAEAIENLLGSLPSGAAQAMLDPALWSSDDPLLGIVKALGQAGAMGVVGGAVIGGALGQIHGVYQAAKGINVPKPPGIDPDVLVPKAKEHLKGEGVPVHEGTAPKVEGDGAAPAKGVGGPEAKGLDGPDAKGLDGPGAKGVADPAVTGGTPGTGDAGTPVKPLGEPPPKQLRAELTDADLAAMGMPESSVKSFKQFADGYGLVIDVRPTNPDALAKLRSGEALPKPEILKQKSITDLDVMLGIDPKHKGLVGHLDPATMSVPKEGSQIVHPTTGETITVDAALHKKLNDRLAKRIDDFGHYEKSVKELLASGQFSIEPPGIIKFGTGPDAKAFTGDHDVFDFRRKDGKPMSPQEYDFYVMQMRQWGMNVEHGAHLHWDTVDPAKLSIAEGHAPGGEPLIRFGEGGTPKEAWWDGRLDAQKDLGPSSDVVRPGGEFASGGPEAKAAGMKPGDGKLDPAALKERDPGADWINDPRHRDSDLDANTKMQDQIEEALGRGKDYEAKQSELRQMYEQQQLDAANTTEVKTTRTDQIRDLGTGTDLTSPDGTPWGYGINSAFTTQRFALGGGEHLTQITIKVKINAAPGVDAPDIALVMANVERGVDTLYNTGTKRLPNGDHVRVGIEFVTDPGAGPHLTVELNPGTGRADQTNWFVGDGDVVHAHELGHQLGLIDEYVDVPGTIYTGNLGAAKDRLTPTSPGVRTDSSLMGDFHLPGGGIDPNVEVKQRHWDQIGGDIEAARAAKEAAAAIGAPKPPRPSPAEVLATSGPAAPAAQAPATAGTAATPTTGTGTAPGGGGTGKKKGEREMRWGTLSTNKRLERELRKAVERGDTELAGLIRQQLDQGGREGLGFTSRESKAADLSDPRVLDLFDQVMAEPHLAGSQVWQDYSAIIRKLYGDMGTVEVGRSPRSVDEKRVKDTNRMRGLLMTAISPSNPAALADPVRFVQQMSANGGAIPEAVELMREHLLRAIKSNGGADGAVAAGEAVWIDARTGAPLESRRAGAVLWPAEPFAHVWRVDHGVELQHGGNDGIDNYVPAPQKVHDEKSRAMNEFARAVAGMD